MNVEKELALSGGMTSSRLMDKNRKVSGVIYENMGDAQRIIT